MIQRTLISICLTLLLVAGILFVGVFGFAHLPLTAQSTTLMLPKGTSAQHMTQQMQRQGIISKPKAMLLSHWIRWKGQSRALKAGEYDLPRRITPQQLLKKLTQGDVIQHTVIFSEGITFKTALERLQAHPAIGQEAVDTTALMHALGETQHGPEGLFFPATYYFTRGTPPTEILKQAHEKMQKQLAEVYAKRSPHCVLKSPYEVLIMASIIEKESALAEELPQISGVFQRRLTHDMLLQADPTLIYGLADQFSGRITSANLKEDKPYNTYVRKGLPPTPIALPGLPAIEAACQPAAGTTLYFVAKGDGSHHFSNTLQEHQAAVKKYQLKAKSE